MRMDVGISNSSAGSNDVISVTPTSGKVNTCEGAGVDLPSGVTITPLFLMPHPTNTTARNSRKKGGKTFLGFLHTCL
jgi:hypothetical protein